MMVASVCVRVPRLACRFGCVGVWLDRVVGQEQGAAHVYVPPPDARVAVAEWRASHRSTRTDEPVV